MSEKENKVSKSYSLPPFQIEWLRMKALEKSTPQKNVSASSILEAIIDEAINRKAEQLPLLPETQIKKNIRATASPLPA